MSCLRQDPSKSSAYACYLVCHPVVFLENQAIPLLFRLNADMDSRLLGILKADGVGPYGSLKLQRNFFLVLPAFSIFREQQDSVRRCDSARLM